MNPEKIKIRRIWTPSGMLWFVTCSACVHLRATRETWGRALVKAKIHAWLRHHVEL